ncbi:MAG: hypothetical protein JWM68_4454 [Verrucomicrobiales bacterium]|nr:hypothetical protein [Verrucomicrobiales bacterium]
MRTWIKPRLSPNHRVVDLSTRMGTLTRGLFLITALSLLFTGCQSTRPPQVNALRVSKDIQFTEFFRRTNGWVSGDGALSVPLSDGRSLWLFGDSHIDSFDRKSKTVPCLFQARNAGLVQMENSFKDAKTLVGTGTGFRSLFKRIPGDDPWFWPLGGFQEKQTAFIYLAELHQAGTGNFGFASTGNDFIAKMTLPEMTVTDYLPVPHLKGRGFGLGFVKEPDGFIYTYGTKGSKAGTDLYVARFKAETPERDWTYWNGNTWTDNLTNAASVFRTHAVSISVCKVRNKIVLTGSALSVKCDMGRDIYMSTSDSPTGPFSPTKKIYTIDDLVKGHSPFFYLPSAHPQFINRKDELLVTYSINGYEPCLPVCVKGRMNPDHYRPRAIRVPLKLIDPDFN